jgi:hypothetical protein
VAYDFTNSLDKSNRGHLNKCDINKFSNIKKFVNVFIGMGCILNVSFGLNIDISKYFNCIFGIMGKILFVQNELCCW